MCILHTNARKIVKAEYIQTWSFTKWRVSSKDICSCKMILLNIIKTKSCQNKKDFCIILATVMTAVQKKPICFYTITHFQNQFSLNYNPQNGIEYYIPFKVSFNIQNSGGKKSLVLT